MSLANAVLNTPHIELTDFLLSIGGQPQGETKISKFCYHEVWLLPTKATALIVVRYGDHGCDVYAPICKQNSIQATKEAIKNY